jgi:hypothetical protein
LPTSLPYPKAGISELFHGNPVNLKQANHQSGHDCCFNFTSYTESHSRRSGGRPVLEGISCHLLKGYTQQLPRGAVRNHGKITNELLFRQGYPKYSATLLEVPQFNAQFQ